MRRHLASRLLLATALGLLVVLLAALQYRWLGQVSELEKEELRHSLERRAQDFAAEVDNEAGKLRVGFASLVDGSDAELAAGIGAQLDAWRPRTRYPDLIAAIHVVSLDGRQSSILTFDETQGVLRSAPPPFALTLASGEATFVDGTPGELIWLPRKADLSAAPSRWPASSDLFPRMRAGSRLLVIQLNRETLATRMLPAMLTHHFGEGPVVESSAPEEHPARLPARLYERGLALRLEIVDADNSPVFSSGLGQGERIPPDRADVATTLLAWDSGSTNPARGSVSLTWIDSGSAPRTEAHFGVQGEVRSLTGDVRSRTPQNSWRLLVQHGAGSLDRAVTLTRRRNLFVNFGILSILASAVGLVLGNARRSEKLAAQQMEFVATVSHELRTPITVIRSAAENLASGIVHEPAQAKQYGELIGSEGRRLTDMVERVLEHANIRANRPVRRRVDVDVAELVRDTVGACEPMITRAGMTIDLDVAADLPHLLGDEAGLRQALENLIANAVKHAGEGRWMGVAARRASPDPRYVIRDRRLGSAGQTRVVAAVVEIAVSDRGPGIDASERDRIFDAFYRGRRALDRQVPGSGLGLSLVARIAEEHFGRVTVGTTPGGGATFVLHLPVLRDAASSDGAGVT